MKRLVVLAALLGIIAAPSVRAEEPSVCKSMCASEKQVCAKRAGRLTELDDVTVEDKNPFAGTAKQMRSETARDAERTDFMKRKRERLDACDASYMRCTKGCAPVAPVTIEKTGMAK